MVHHCHCSMCRKTSGAAFGTFGGFPAADFRFTRGEAGIRRYPSSPGGVRAFCGRCGSAVPGQPFEDLIFVPFGNLEGDPGGRPMAHIFVTSKAPWYEIADDLPRFDAYPPGYPDPELPPREPRHVRPGSIGGSCLCDAVRFELEPPLGRWHNCHCSRCRRARGTAHASNVFLDAERFRWIRGEDQVDFYKLPEAERFGQAFCRTCGAKMPRINRKLGYVAVPAGSLDDDPGARPERHIYVESKAPWFEIADTLPRFAELPDY